VGPGRAGLGVPGCAGRLHPREQLRLDALQPRARPPVRAGRHPAAALRLRLVAGRVPRRRRPAPPLRPPLRHGLRSRALQLRCARRDGDGELRARPVGGHARGGPDRDARPLRRAAGRVPGHGDQAGPPGRGRRFRQPRRGGADPARAARGRSPPPRLPARLWRVDQDDVPRRGSAIGHRGGGGPEAAPAARRIVERPLVRAGGGAGAHRRPLAVLALRAQLEDMGELGGTSPVRRAVPARGRDGGDGREPRALRRAIVPGPVGHGRGGARPRRPRAERNGRGPLPEDARAGAGPRGDEPHARPLAAGDRAAALGRRRERRLVRPARPDGRRAVRRAGPRARPRARARRGRGRGLVGRAHRALRGLDAVERPLLLRLLRRRRALRGVGDRPVPSGSPRPGRAARAGLRGPVLRLLLQPGEGSGSSLRRPRGPGRGASGARTGLRQRLVPHALRARPCVLLAVAVRRRPRGPGEPRAARGLARGDGHAMERVGVPVPAEPARRALPPRALGRSLARARRRRALHQRAVPAGCAAAGRAGPVVGAGVTLGPSGNVGAREPLGAGSGAQVVGPPVADARLDRAGVGEVLVQHLAHERGQLGVTGEAQGDELAGPQLGDARPQLGRQPAAGASPAGSRGPARAGGTCVRTAAGRAAVLGRLRRRARGEAPAWPAPDRWRGPAGARARAARARWPGGSGPRSRRAPPAWPARDRPSS